MTVPAVQGEIPISVWLRQQREPRGWSRRELARRLIQAGREAGDTSMPSAKTMYHNVYRWEQGEHALTERYKLYYCKVFGIPAAEFGRQAPDPGSLSHLATVNAHGRSISLQYISGRLVIEISDMETKEQETESGRGLSLVTSPDPPRNYGGRA